MSALPTANLKLSDVADALGMSLVNISMYAVFNNTAVNGDGLDSTYCAGADAAEKLSNLRTTPYNLGKFRGYDHSGGGGLYTAIICYHSTSKTPCGGISMSTTVYSTQGAIFFAYINQQEIYSDSGGNTIADAGWYSDDEVNWFLWDSSRLRWVDSTVCTSIITINAAGPYASQLAACLSGGKGDDYYFLPTGSNTVPVTGDEVYTDFGLTNPCASGYYVDGFYVSWWRIGLNGVVIEHGKC
ncbi:MAG: hypothetical protein PF694_09320 [Bacteroidetes bacterium]|jgi:hypothetical protein|nr:hypothetical protein [Bacteroidota bacterium]